MQLELSARELALLIFPLLMMAAGIGDVMTLRIPNRLTAAMAILFLPFAFAAGLPLVQVAEHMATGFGLLSVGYLLFALGILGGGDAKLMAAAGLWFGFGTSLEFVIFTALAGGVLAMAIGLMHMTHIEMTLRGGGLSRVLKPFKADVPYGYAFAIGAIMACPSSWLMPPAGA